MRLKKTKLSARDALLFVMKAAVPHDSVPRGDFRDDVMWMCEQWKGGPFAWFASTEGTAIVELGSPSRKPREVKGVCVRLERLTQVAGRLFVVEDDQLIETDLPELLEALNEYYS